MNTINLQGEWQFKSDNENVWLNTSVPATQYSSLLYNGKIKDPFVGTNEKTGFWAACCKWQFKKNFLVDDAFFNARKIDLVYGQLDALCKVIINGKTAFSSDNAHTGGRQSVKEFLHIGENEIVVEFDSPVEYIKQKQSKDKMPHNMNGLNGVSHIRKAQCHFGWDWGPVIPVCGIMREFYMESYDFSIDYVDIRQTHFNHKVKLDISVTSDNPHETATMLFLDVAAPDGKVIQSKAQALKNKNDFVFDIVNPELWWTNDLSDLPEQPLYEVRAYIVKDESVRYKQIKSIGLRTIELKREPDEYGRQFQFILNGVPLFIKGANWIPADSLPDRITRSRLEYLIESAKYANMNMLRVWGGGYYESDEFYDLCDRKGILVWQDLCFACNPYPFYNTEFLSSVKDEIAYNARRLKHRASLAVWCGNNEIEAMSMLWRGNKKQYFSTKDFFYGILPDFIKSFDNATPFINGSPTGDGFMKKVGSDNVGDTHLWHVWHGLRPLDYYGKRYTRFCSEFGLESLCDMQTVETFAKKSDFSLNSKVFRAHQKCAGGNKKILFYMSTRFALPRRFEDIVYLSQITQAECVSNATEHWRRNRGRCNGSMYWQFNDCWPVTSWAGIDYCGRYKALQYRARHFNAPQSVSVKKVKNGVQIYVFNDKTAELTANVICSLRTFDGTTLKVCRKRICVPPATSAHAFSADYSRELKKYKKWLFVHAELEVDDKIINEKTALFAAEKHLNLPDGKIELATEFCDGFAIITAKSTNYKRFVKLELKNSVKPFSDNYFDLLPNAEKKVAVEIPVGMSQADFVKNLSAVSVADIIPKSNLFHDFCVRQHIRFEPANIIQFLARLFT